MLSGFTKSIGNRMLQSLFPLGWGHYLAGGLLIGVGVSLLFVATGWIGGMSSVFTSTWSFVSRRGFFQHERFVGTRVWRLVYAAGLVIGAALWWILLGPGERLQTGIPAWQLGAGSVLVGFGARMANGCTSGHGICGLSSFQWPSLGAVLIFMTTGALAANMVIFLGGH
jgi:uncharacterized membrane protein YedE/YeeE